MPQHISTAYDDDLLLISGKLTEMGGICEEMLNKSLQAILKNQSDLAQSIIQTDEKVDELENEIEELKPINNCYHDCALVLRLLRRNRSC